jgi:hypothetical protein
MAVRTKWIDFKYKKKGMNFVLVNYDRACPYRESADMDMPHLCNE